MDRPILAGALTELAQGRTTGGIRAQPMQWRPCIPVSICRDKDQAEGSTSLPSRITFDRVNPVELPLARLRLTRRQHQDQPDQISVLTVTARLGGGSPNDISPVVTAWKAKHPLEKPEEIPLDPSVAKMLAKQIALCAAVAAQSAEALLAEAVEDVRTLSARGQVLEQRVTALETELENALQEIQRLKGELSERTQLYDAAREESLAAIEASEAAAASERATAESLRDKLVRSEIRIEGLLGAEQALTVAEQELKRVTENFSQLKEAAAIAQERTGAAVQRAEQAEAREAAARADSAQLHERLQAAHASAHELAKTLANVSANLAESLERQGPLKEAAEAIIASLNRYGAQRPVGPAEATASD